MAIRTLNTEIFDQITANSTKQKEGFETITQDETQYLYDKAEEELQACMTMLADFKEAISNLFCGDEILSTDEATVFFCTTALFIDELIPSILKGDHKETYKYCNEEITIEELDQARVEFFEKLYNKYLKR